MSDELNKTAEDCAKAREHAEQLMDSHRRIWITSATAEGVGAVVAAIGLVTLKTPIMGAGGSIFAAGKMGMAEADHIKVEATAAASDADTVCSGLPPSPASGRKR